ncbi:hypothetical protein QBC35DRAFT_395888 [Podospora australis]|uniref:Uncharacterized protein n=1 Tax=Podospora australis TaxID=1536484 RepID=A0AAN6WIJ5_9PEZI|nr:hypothetical protein QBC35DRAFT_395888 [Podospora australis]
MFSMRAILTILTCLLFSTLALAQATPKSPSLNFLYSLNCTLGPALQVGGGPIGTRTVIPITGGTFSGPRLSGKVLNLGADWGLTDSKGLFSADTRYQLQTNDGAHIFIRTSGPTQSDGYIHLRIQFETGSSKYYWLNNIIAVGILKAGAGGVAIDAWELVSPK